MEGEAEAVLLCNNVNAFGLDRCAEKYFVRRECGALHHCLPLCLPGSLVKMLNYSNKTEFMLKRSDQLTTLIS